MIGVGRDLRLGNGHLRIGDLAAGRFGRVDRVGLGGQGLLGILSRRSFHRQGVVILIAVPLAGVSGLGLEAVRVIFRQVRVELARLGRRLRFRGLARLRLGRRLGLLDRPGRHGRVATLGIDAVARFDSSGVNRLSLAIIGGHTQRDANGLVGVLEERHVPVTRCVGVGDSTLAVHNRQLVEPLGLKILILR